MALKNTLLIRVLPGFLKKRFYRWRGAKIGKNVKFGFLSLIDADVIEIGDNSEIGMGVRIIAREFKMGAYSKIGKDTAIATRRVKIGNETTIQDHVIIGGMQTIESRIEIGDRCTIFRESFLNPTKTLRIGNEVGIGGANYIFTHGTWPDVLEGYPATFGPVTIEDNVWLPWRVFILPNVTIGKGSIIAAGSVVSKSIPPYSFAAGAPAVIKKSGSDFIQSKSLAEKQEILAGVFSGFRSYLKLNKLAGKDIQINEEEGVIWEGYLYRGKTVKAFLSVRRASPKSFSLQKKIPIYCVSLSKIEESMKTEIEKSGGAWFDIAGHSWMGRRTAIQRDIRGFLARFGIRFESLDLSG